MGPILLVDDPRLELADGPEAERLEVAERLACAVDGAAVRSRAGRYARTIAGRSTSTRAPRPSSTSSNAGSTVVPPGANRDRISLTASTASLSAVTDSSSQAPSAETPSSRTSAGFTTGRP